MAQPDLSSAFQAKKRGYRLAPVTVGVVGLVLLVASLFVPIWQITIGCQLAGGVLLLTALAVHLQSRKLDARQRRLLSAVGALVEHDLTPTFLTDDQGEVLFRNAAAGAANPDRPVDTLVSALDDVFANPGAVLFRLQNKANGLGAIREDIVTRRGQIGLIVTLVGESNYLWRIDRQNERAQARSGESTSLPMLTAGPTGTVLFMNEPFRRLVGARARSLDRIFTDLPLVAGRVHTLSSTLGETKALVAVVSGTSGRQEVYLIPGGTSSAVPALNASWDAIEELPVPLLKVARTGELLASNREARALLGGRISDTARLSDLLEGLGRPIIDWLQEVAAGRGLGESQFLRGRGENQDFFVQVSLNSAGEGEDRHLIAVLNDMTEFKSLEAQFVQSQKMQAIGQLAGGVAHDFNNLLTAISGHCDLLLLRHGQEDPDYSDLIQIHQNANRAASLVGQLLAFSRKQNLRPEVLDLRDTLADLTHLLNRLVGEKMKLLLNHDPDLLPIRADKRQLEQVLMNLVVNARDAMPAGGEIRIETENVSLAEPVFRDRATLPIGDYVLVKVVDEGLGIPAEKISKIFEPFYTTKRTGEGTGLGLSTAYGIVKQTGGFIFADSEVGIGTVFTLYFPIYDGPPEVEQTSSAAEPLVLEHLIEGCNGDEEVDSRGVILLVEDEAPVRAFASRALRLRGHTVLEADCAEAALEVLQDEELHVDIFVTDVIMPGQDGPTWVREALKSRPKTRVVFVSGYAEDDFGEHQASIPNSVFLPKPFSLTDLTETVQHQLH